MSPLLPTGSSLRPKNGRDSQRKAVEIVLKSKESNSAPGMPFQEKDLNTRNDIRNRCYLPLDDPLVAATG
jgi:hypothetical protein